MCCCSVQGIFYNFNYIHFNDTIKNDPCNSAKQVVTNFDYWAIDKQLHNVSMGDIVKKLFFTLF